MAQRCKEADRITESSSKLVPETRPARTISSSASRLPLVPFILYHFNESNACKSVDLIKAITLIENSRAD